jgi:hypothetical protein
MPQRPPLLAPHPGPVSWCRRTEPALPKRQIAHYDFEVSNHRNGLLQINDVNTVARAEDVGFHLRIPAAGLVPEMDSRFEQLFHGNIDHNFSPSV